ncbi:PREDICTED: YDG domain-containing protein At5g47150-like [Fragaria vesca subsp. vesca]|uniref:YDG domain-containing protein At5g47150-like n=1 Tax=Fragaria vesca subsp. vesca TaxID=101020 RepID=UPI0002C36FBE|nr:PREDICTED: YDG domain-containing protein At5g47150-like [Fragaria vesca subsp. vesca]XP_011465235.1 PREDICTED: YDG domain-containing protein At5g47150-like [Fragaria vesca subsp. vesca]XP_011465236.1 PREDICTED: YDG domain-containing protein At5g47150-like [Fragaria vesca subsp. vesca]
MGSEGSLQRTGSSRKHDEETLGSSHSKLLDHKRPRVSAIRDFAPGCGRSTHFTTSVGSSDDMAREHHVPAVRDFPQGCGPSARLTTSVGTSDVARKHHVGAVRDFPPQCGTSASQEARNFDREAQSVKGDKPSTSSNTDKTNVYRSWWTGKVAHRSKPNGDIGPIKKQPEANRQPERSRNDSDNTRGKTTQFSAASLRNNNTSLIRTKVTETLSRFRDLCIEIERKKLREGAANPRRIDFEAAKILKKERGYVNTGSQIMGDVPGVEVGDIFRYRIELTIVGLHRQIEGGIDYTHFGNESLATSIVASGGYADDTHDLNSLTYTGHGGSVMHHNLPEHQELKRGNLALKNSIDAENPVRVIHGSETSGGRKQYVYVGLYLVERWWKETGDHGKIVYKFQLNRIQGQRSIPWLI